MISSNALKTTINNCSRFISHNYISTKMLTWFLSGSGLIREQLGFFLNKR